MKWGITCFVIYDYMMPPESRWALIKDLYIVSTRFLVNFLFNFLNNPVFLLVLLTLYFRCSWKSSLVSEIITRCFWDLRWMTTVSLKFNGDWFGLLSFLEKELSKSVCWDPYENSFSTDMLICLNSLDHQWNSSLISDVLENRKDRSVIYKEFGI